jgi:4-hydroxybenzoate polyprenyltransferase
MLSDIKCILVSMRPTQWIKNVFIFVGILFSQRLFQLDLLLSVAAGFILFSLTASSVYLVNDIRDAEKDRHHPEKCTRPIAAGHLKIGRAYIAAISLAFFAVAGGYLLNPLFGFIQTAYILMNLSYSLKLKHLVILDVMVIALGFVLRVLAGTALAGVSPSDWLILCTLTLSFFLGFGKRRHELVSLEEGANDHREVLNAYSIPFLDQMIAVVTACTVMSYALYTMSPETVNRFGTRNLIFTIPFVIYGIFRYLYLIYHKKNGGNPSSIVISDRPFLVNGFLWLSSVILVIYYG